MGHRKVNAPRRGSLAFIPRGRAQSQTGRIRFWPHIEAGPIPLGFMGYKAGMTHIFMVEDQPGSPNFGKEVMYPATVIDAPPLIICGIRAYTQTPYGLKAIAETWMKDPPKDINRLTTPPKNPDPENGFKKMEEKLPKITEFRLLAATQPRLAGVPKKTPDFVEIKVDGAQVKDQFEYVKTQIGKNISATGIFKEGQYVDVVAITKGKGTQGPVKRFGVKIRDRKTRKTQRGIGTLGPWSPSRVLYTIARSGQMGYNQRTEYNKRILKIGVDGAEVSPKGGFIRYGPVKGAYVLVSGSIPGPTKRLIRLRYPTRASKRTPEAPKIVSISQESPQG
jgi:large subunit ribosomal protein L3